MGRKWSDKEKEILQKLYPKVKARAASPGVWKRLEKALPNRSHGAIRAKAAKTLGSIRPHWSPKQDALLKKLWSDCSTRTICRAIGRTWKAITMRAQKIGLEGRWQGYVTVAQAAKRLGYHHNTMTRLVEMSGIGVYSRVSNSDGHKFKHRVVEWDAILEYVTEHLAQETPSIASARTGVPASTINQWLTRAGMGAQRRGVQVRLPRKEMDALINKHKAEWLKRRKVK